MPQIGMFEGEDIHELRIELLAYRLTLGDCEERKRYLARYSAEPVDRLAMAIDGLIPNKKHVFRRFRRFPHK